MDVFCTAMFRHFCSVSALLRESSLRKSYDITALELYVVIPVPSEVAQWCSWPDCRFCSPLVSNIRELKITTTATATGTSLNKRFNEMSRTMVLHVRYNSLYILCRPLQNNNVKWPNSALSEERELPRLIFKNSISNSLRFSRFSFAIAWTVMNKVNDLRVSRDS